MSVDQRLDRIVLLVEARLGRWGVAALAGIAGLGLALLCVRAGTEPVSLGRFYAALSLDPLAFDADNPVGYRILTPLFSWALGLRGEAIQLTNLGLAAVVLMGVASAVRTRAPRPGDALVAVGFFALSLVTLSTVFAPSYCDPATYLAVLVMWVCRRQRPIYYAAFALGLFNRESIVFLLPWFVFLDLQDTPRRRHLWLEQLVGFGAGLLLLFGFRAWVSSQIDVTFTLDYYLAPLREDLFHYWNLTAGRKAIGLYSVFGILWVAPLLAIVAKARRGDLVGIASMGLVVAASFAQLAIAYDTSRLLTLGFPVMWLALDELFGRDAFAFRRWAPWLLAIHFFLPHVRTAQQRVWTMDAPWRDVWSALF